MSDQTNTQKGGGSAMLAFALGAAVVALAVGAWFLFTGAQIDDQPDVRIEVPGVGAIEGDVSGDG